MTQEKFDYHTDDCLWIMLNPSTATADEDDPTIRRCIAFSKSWGFAGLVVTNAYAWRATDPDELVGLADPVGPGNDTALERMIERHATIIVAWGKRAGTERANKIALAAMIHGRTLMCLRHNDDRSPEHPLYVPGATTPVPWQPAG